jgi:hypothetical protein
MEKVKITVDGNDVGWLKTFNEWTSDRAEDVKMGEIVSINNPILKLIGEFNHCVAEGPAIGYEEVN